MATLASVPLPKLVELLRQGYSVDALLNDLVAGVTVGLVALPLAMAFAIASGVPPQNGLYCAVVAGFIDLRARRLAHADWRPDRARSWSWSPAS